jgi:NDP-sugar pyrophosphorylase family protein
VLAAGAGTRLRPLTDVLPKPLAPVGGRPVVVRLLDRLEPLGLDAVAMNLHHGADLIEQVVAGRGVDCLREEWLRGTAGALAGAESFLRAGGDFLVLSSDGAHDVDLGAFVERHRSSRALATITVKRLPRPEACAVVELDDDGLVRRFVEKPPPGEVFSDQASIGIYCFAPEVLDLIPDDRPYDIAGELIPALLERGLPVAAYETDAWWSDIGTADELLRVNLALGQVVDSEIAADARLEPPVMVGPRARVGSGAHVARSLVLPGAEVAPRAVVADTIHGSGEDVVRAWLR